MLAVISPAKTLDYNPAPPELGHTEPRLLEHSQELIQILRTHSALDLAELMKISMKLANLNFGRFQDWERRSTSANSKQAVLAMKGDVYAGLDAESFSADDFDFAQRHLRILSGLYGVLRPLDLMQPYRLEMGTRLRNARGKDLYAFWGNTISETLNGDLAAQGDNLLVNLASNEYFAAVRPKALHGHVVHPVFKERKEEAYRVIGIHAKRARGLMSRFLIRNRVSEAEQLKEFDAEGYRFRPELSDGDRWVFARG